MTDRATVLTRQLVSTVLIASAMWTGVNAVVPAAHLPVAAAAVAAAPGQCFSIRIPETSIRSSVQSSVAGLDAARADITQTGSTKVEVTSRGIEGQLRFKVRLNNFPDPELKIGYIITLKVQGGAVVPAYRTFSVDVDWPWWVSGVTHGVSKIVEEVAEGSIKGKLKGALLSELRKVVDAYQERLPSGYRLLSVRTTAGEVVVTACPPGSAIPTPRPQPPRVTCKFDQPAQLCRER